MGRFLIKCDKAVDLYIEWSSIVDAPTAIGTRAQFEKMLNTPKRGSFWGTEEETKARLDRVDKYGSSDRLGLGAWDDNGLIYKQEGFLPRRNFLEYGKRLVEDADAKPMGLLEPFEDDK